MFTYYIAISQTGAQGVECYLSKINKCMNLHVIIDIIAFCSQV